METSVTKGIPRIEVELPPGLRLGGIEGTMDPLALTSGKLPPERIARGDRDLARYMAILYKPVEDSLCLVFRTGALLREAKKVWEAKQTGGRLFSFGPSATKRSGFGGGGDDSENLRRALTQSRCGFIVFVAPRSKQLRVVEQLSEELSSDVCILLVNARLRGTEDDELRERLSFAFNPVFHLRLFGDPGSEGIVFRALQKDGPTPWVIAERQLQTAPDGQERFSAKELSRSIEEPSLAKIMASLGAKG